MSNKIALKNDVYKGFVQGQILRPYQTTLYGEVIDPVYFSEIAYSMLPKMMVECPKWTELVFNRMAKIYDSIDASLFPEGETKTALLQKMSEKGIIIT